MGETKLVSDMFWVFIYEFLGSVSENICQVIENMRKKYFIGGQIEFST